MTQLWLVRHGQTDWNLTGRWQGQSPDAPPLNEFGKAQILSLQNQLRNMCISAIYASDLLRSRQTAELIASLRGLDVILEPRLREMNLGEWEGMLSTEIQAKYPREMAARIRDPLRACAPGGESPMQVVKRVIAAMKHIMRKYSGESILIVAHGISLAIISCMARGIPLGKLYENVPENAKLCHIEWEPSRRIEELFLLKYSGNLSLSVNGEAEG